MQALPAEIAVATIAVFFAQLRTRPVGPGPEFRVDSRLLSKMQQTFGRMRVKLPGSIYRVLT